MRIAAQKINDIAEIDIDGVAHRHEMRKTDIVGARPIEDGGAQRAGLRNEGYAAGLGREMGKAGVEADAGNQDAQAVGAEDAHAVTARIFRHHFLEGAAFRILFLRQSRGQHDDRLGALGAQFLGDAGNGLRRRANDGQIRCHRQVSDARIGQNAGNRLLAGVHRHDRTAEATEQKVAHNQGADGSRAIGSADHSDGRGIEQFIKIFCGHGRPSFFARARIATVAVTPSTGSLGEETKPTAPACTTGGQFQIPRRGRFIFGVLIQRWS